MAYDNLDLDIKSRLPHWWSSDTLLEPINQYTQEIFKDIIGSLLSKLGIVQFCQVWKSVPTEYSYIHTYQTKEDNLKYTDGTNASLTLKPNEPIRAYLPDTKRDHHAFIQLSLDGDGTGNEVRIPKLTIKNQNQKIIFNDITTLTDIKIYTEDRRILIDGVQNSDLVKGRFDKIYRQAKTTDYSSLDVDEPNQETYIEIESDIKTDFELKVKLIHPVYVTEQNIRVHSLSAFPIENIKLYGLYCHEFNNKSEWKFLWEKNYKENDRIIFDRITKQFDCETFFVQIKLYGLGIPLTYGFPQDLYSSNTAFQINSNLDKWGQVLQLPRRYYKTRITDEEEPYTFPPYYKYDIEQDYFYEQRLVNEYRHNDDATNSTFIKDTELQNIAVLKCIDPYIEDLYVYTETIKGFKNHDQQTEEIFPSVLSDSGDGVTWQTPHEVANSNATATEVKLQPQSSESFNDKTNQTQTLEIYFNDIPTLPKNIIIKGIELKLNGFTNMHSDNLMVDERSRMYLPNTYNPEKYDIIQIDNDYQYWEKGRNTYTIGSPEDLFGLDEIKREQVQGGLKFTLGLTNLNTYLSALIVLYSIKLVIYYETIKVDYTMNVRFSKNEIILSEDNKEIQMWIDFNNIGELPAVDKCVYIAVSDGLNISYQKTDEFDLKVGEKFTIGDGEDDKIIITPSLIQRTGKYDVVVFCDDKVIRNEIIVRQRGRNDSE